MLATGLVELDQLGRSRRGTPARQRFIQFFRILAYPSDVEHIIPVPDR